jgi:hypothetical protein
MLVLYSNWAVKTPNVLSVLGFMLVATYMVAQSGWTTAFILGDVWGRDLSNYIWFVFNSLVLGLLTVLWKKHK